MKELIRRLARSKQLTAELLVATLLVNILALASPIYVIQILGRYIAYGFNGTLYTLTGGMIIALILSHFFSLVRNKMAASVSAQQDNELAGKVLDAVITVKAQAFQSIPHAKLQEIVAGANIVKGAYGAQQVTAVLDLPFFLLFVLAIMGVSPLLAVITLVAVILTVAAGVRGQKSAAKIEKEYRESSSTHRGLVSTSIHGGESVRAFLGARLLRPIFEKQLSSLSQLTMNAGNKKTGGALSLQSLAGGLRILVYAVGAQQVVIGEMTVGGLIGVSILSGMALGIASKFTQALLLFGKARETLTMLTEFLSLPRESHSGTAMRDFTGKLELKDLGFAFPRSSGPLFESLNLVVEPGKIIGVTGPNGAGKSTLVKLIVGLLEPGRGQILADGIDIRQLSLEWWRQQIAYLPQEPRFLSRSIGDNIRLLNPEIADAEFNEILRVADLRNYLDSTADGVGTILDDGGASLSLGIRKRIALARALAGNAKICILDEPTEGLDAEGARAVYMVMNDMAKQGVTLIVISRDASITKGFNVVVDLASKPIPDVRLINGDHGGGNS